MGDEELHSPSTSFNAPGDCVTLKDRWDLSPWPSPQCSNDAADDKFAVSQERKFRVLSDDIWVSRTEKIETLVKKKAIARSEPRRALDSSDSDTVSDHKDVTTPEGTQTSQEEERIGQEEEIRNDNNHSFQASQTKEGTQARKNGEKRNQVERDPQGFHPAPFTWQGFDNGTSFYIDHNDYDLFAVPSNRTSTETLGSSPLKPLGAENPSLNQDARQPNCCCLKIIPISSICKTVRRWFSPNRASNFTQGSGPKHRAHSAHSETDKGAIIPETGKDETRSAPSTPRHRWATFFNYILI